MLSLGLDIQNVMVRHDPPHHQLNDIFLAILATGARWCDGCDAGDSRHPPPFFLFVATAVLPAMLGLTFRTSIGGHRAGLAETSSSGCWRVCKDSPCDGQIRSKKPG